MVMPLGLQNYIALIFVTLTYRSFLLQLLLRHNDSIETHLEKFISHKEPFLQVSVV
jgi:hypothetical protein